MPVIGGDEGICAGCGADIADMPIACSPTFTTVVNAGMCEYLGVAIPEGDQPLGN